MCAGSMRLECRYNRLGMLRDTRRAAPVTQLIGTRAGLVGAGAKCCTPFIHFSKIILDRQGLRTWTAGLRLPIFSFVSKVWIVSTHE